MRSATPVLALVAFGLAAVYASGRPDAAPAKPENYAEKMPGADVKMEMIGIPGGEFLMGSPANEAGREADEGPQHRVTIKPFWMQKFEATWDEYDLFWKVFADLQRAEEGEKPKLVAVGADALTGPTNAYSDETFGHGREKHPVLCITQHAMMEYARWLSSKTGKTYRLPTEAEWEYACRAGTTTAYPWGNDASAIKEHAIYADNADDKTSEVGKKKPNAWGLYDMVGNVAEMCLEHYSKDDYAKFPAGLEFGYNKARLPTAKRFSHAIRGGSWADEPPKLRSAARRGTERNFLKRDPQRPQSIWWFTDAEFVGFRLVRSVEDDPELKKYLSIKLTRQSPYGP